MSEIPICQSCGMPMEQPEDFGSNDDGGKNSEYCQHCWQAGDFTAKVGLSEFIEMQVKIATEHLGLSEDEAREVAVATLPELKRWRQI